MAKINAKLLSDHGINTMAIAYFNVPDSPKIIKEVPIDYMERAITYAKSVHYEKIGLWGISMGSIYVLLSACYFPDLVDVVMAASPCYFVIQAIDSRWNTVYDCSSCSYKGKGIPYEPFGVKVSLAKTVLEALKHLEPSYAYVYQPMVGKVPEEHWIPVEKMKARVILFSGKLDELLPSYEFAEIIMKRLRDSNYSYPYEHIVCEYGGHLMAPFPTPLDVFIKANRKYKKEAEQYRKEHLDKILDTFKTL